MKTLNYMLQVDEVVNGIKGIGGELKEDHVVKKVLGSLPRFYNHRVFAIEENKNLDIY